GGLNETFERALREDGGFLLVQARLAVGLGVRQIPDIGAVREGADDERRVREAAAGVALRDVVMFAVESEPDGVAESPGANRVRVVARRWQGCQAFQPARRAFDHGTRVPRGLRIAALFSGCLFVLPFGAFAFHGLARTEIVAVFQVDGGNVPGPDRG